MEFMCKLYDATLEIALHAFELVVDHFMAEISDVTSAKCTLATLLTN
jgi:hypothetical protein